MAKKRVNKENIYNIPNSLSLIRIIMSPVLAALVFYGIGLIPMIILFAVAALTDFLDGFIARRYGEVTDFGRKIDMIADRVLMISIVLSIFVYSIRAGLINQSNSWLIVIIMAREIISAPFFVFALFMKNKRPLPHARLFGKMATLFQGITFPMILLGWNISRIFAIATCVIGVISAGYYIYDSLVFPNNKFQKLKDNYYIHLRDTGKK